MPYLDSPFRIISENFSTYFWQHHDFINLLQGLLYIWTVQLLRYFGKFKPLEISKNDGNSICLTSKDIQFSKIIRVWLKNWVCHAHLKFWRFLAGNPNLDAPRTLIFGTKRVPNEVNNWWKFGVDISNHFWVIQNLAFFLFLSIPHVVKFSDMGDRKKRKTS